MPTMKKQVEAAIEENGFDFDAYLITRDGMTWGDYSIGLPKGFVHIDEHEGLTGLSGMVDHTTHFAWKFILEDIKQIIEAKPDWIREGECPKDCCK